MTPTADSARGPRERRYWRSHLETLRPAEVPTESRVTAAPAGDPGSSDALLRLYLEGRKTAGSSLLEDFVTANDPVPEVGDHWIVLASGGEPRCILRTVEVQLHRFADIPQAVAIAEGEGDASVAAWKRVHAEVYAPRLAQWGIADIEESTVVTEFLEIVHRSH